jgi:hypothetical protein
MSWLDETGFERRPLVFVEDHLYHTGELLAALHAQRPDLVSHTTVVSIDREGPDTAAAVSEWLSRYSDVQVAATGATGSRVRAVTPADTHDAAAFARFVSRLLRPGGILVQDVQLSTLPYVPADRWWDSIYTAATVRGLFASQAPCVRFLSNKRGYAATFGRELSEAGFDPRDVMDKSELTSIVVPAVASLFDRAFPLTLRAAAGSDANPAPAIHSWPIAPKAISQPEVEPAFDLLLWRIGEAIELGGRAISNASGGVAFKSGAAEAATWGALIEDALGRRQGLPVIAIGERIGPPDAGRAELTNLAARHIHTLRSRLASPDLIVTADHRYRLKDDLRAGLVDRRT